MSAGEVCNSVGFEWRDKTLAIEERLARLEETAFVDEIFKGPS